MKNPIRILGQLFVPTIAIAVFSLCASTARAATDTWTGGGGDDIFMHTANNWGGVAPVADDDLIFTGTSSLIASNNFPVGTKFNSITFESPAGAFVLEGRSITVGSGVTNNVPFTPQTINLSLIASNTVGVDVVDGGVLNLGGELQGPSGFTVTGNGTVNLNYNGASQTTNVFRGTLEVDGGTIAPASDLSLGTTNDLTSPQAGRLVLDGGSLEASGNLLVNTNRGIAIGPGWGGLVVDTSRTLTYGGIIADNGGSGGLAKAGYGTLELSGQNTYTGPTTNSTGTLLLDMGSATASSGVINSGSALTLGGGNAGLSDENVSRLLMAGGTEGDSQSFASAFATLGASVIEATNGSGGTVNLSLGDISHEPGGTMIFVTPEQSGGGHVNTTTANVNGILGGWALLSADTNGPVIYHEGSNGGQDIVLGTNFATVDISGNIVNYTGFSNVTAGAGTIVSQVVGSPEPPNLYIDDSAGATAINLDTDNAGTINDINAIKWNANNFSTFSIGISNTLRLGKFGGIIRNGTVSTAFFGGSNSVVQSGNGLHGDGNIGTLTAGGADNTPGEIVIADNKPSESSGTTIFECNITDNGNSPVSVIKIGPGSIKLDGGNTFSGGLYLLQGRVQTEATEIANTNADGTLRNGAGAGDIYIFPGTYFLGDTAYTNHFFVAGIGDAHENFGVFRGATVNGPITLMGDAIAGCDTTHLNGIISGAFNFTVGAPGRNGIISIGSPATSNDWSGDTFFSANSGRVNSLISSNNEIIPNGFGKGNVTMTAAGSGVIGWNMNSFSETINGLSSTGANAAGVNVGISNTVASTTSILTVGDNDQSGTYGGNIRGDAAGAIALTKIGAGVETLTNANTYTGDTTISNGVLQLIRHGSINNSPLVDIEGGTFDVSGVSYTIPATHTVNVNNGTFKINTASSTGSGSLNMTNGTLEVGTASLIADYSGTLNLGGVQNIIRVDNFPKEGDWPHTFPVVAYSSLGGDPNTLAGEFPSIQYQGYFSNDLASSTIYVVITNGPITVSVIWGGGSDGNWDILGENNWLFNAAATNYADGDIVTFPDVASQHIVHLTDDFNVGGLTVSNSLGNTYTFDDIGSINGTNQVVKDGPGKWILDNSADNNGGVNGLSGGISIVAGTIQVGNNDANGNLGPDINSIGDNGSLIFDRSDSNAVPNAISGSGNIVVENGTVDLSGANSFGGTVEVQPGVTLIAGNNLALGSTNNGTTIDSGATLDVSGGGLGANALDLGAEPVIVSGTGVGGNGAIVNSSPTAAQQNALQQVILADNTTVGGASGWSISGAGAGLSTSGNSYNLTKIGAGLFGLTNVTVDPMLADIDIQSGIFDVGGTTTGLGDTTSNLIVESGATLQLDNATNQFNKQIALNGNGSATTLTNATGNNTIIGSMTLNGPVIVGGGTNTILTLSNAISGSGSLTKNGVNTLVLTGPNDTYSGATTVNDGTLLINGLDSGSTLTENVSATTPVNVSLVGGNGTNAAPVDIEDTLWPGVGGAPATFGAGDGTSYNGDGGGLVLGYTGSGLPKAEFSLNTGTTAGGGVNDLVTVNGDLNGNFGHVVINPLTPLTVGTPYTLVTYTGNKLNNFSGAIGVLSTLQPTRYAFSLDYGTAGKVLLNVTTGAGNLVWNNHAANGIWDVNNNVNWLNTGTSANDVFDQLDVATFDDSILPGPTNTVTVSTNVAPGSVIVNTTNNYVLTGSGKITGTTGLEKDGSGALIVGNTGNDYTGPTLINAGTLVVDAANALGAGTNAVTIASGATLDVGGADLGNNAGTILAAKPIIVSGWGVNSNGAIINSSSQSAQQNAIQNVTLAGDTAFGGPGLAQGSPNNLGRWDIRGGTPTLSTSGNAYNLYKVGLNQVSLVGTTVDTNLADIHVYGGEFGVETTTSGSLGNPTNTITVESGCSFEMFNFAGPLNKNLVVNGGGIISNKANIWFNSGSYPSNTIASPVIITNGLVVIGGGGSGTFSNTISGPGSVLISGGVTLVAANTYTGNTTVSNNGTVFLVDSASIDDSTNIILGGGTVDVTGRTDYTLTLSADSLQTLSGGGTVNGTLSSPSGATVSLGTATTVGILTVTTNASLSGVTSMKLDPANNTNDVMSVAGMVTYGGTLNITNISDFALGANQSQTFKLFNATTYNLNFGSIQLPTIPGISWDTSEIGINGTITANSTVTPTPVITSISLSGTTLTFTATNGTASGSYTLLSSTNVALPLSQWTPVFTNNFDGSGDINLSTNVIDPNDQQKFYILQVP